MKWKTNIFIGIILSGIFLITACKKNVPQPTSSPVKTEYSILTNNGITDTSTTTYTYNSNKQVLTAVTTMPSLGTTDSISYAYGSGTVTVYTSPPGSTVTYTLNSQGFAEYDNLGDTWTYNNPGYLVSSSSPSSGTTTTYNYNISYQLVSTVLISAGDTTTTTYTYGSQSVPTGSNAVPAGSNGQTGLNIGSLWTTQVTTVSIFGTSVTHTATYVLSGNNITMSTITGTGYNDITTYTYY